MRFKKFSTIPRKASIVGFRSKRLTINYCFASKKEKKTFYEKLDKQEKQKINYYLHQLRQMNGCRLARLYKQKKKSYQQMGVNTESYKVFKKDTLQRAKAHISEIKQLLR
ncbi:hypothetical protein [Microscilla marina]|uniref:Uncharacterized protein n=1 Tax=Microscilla marina ATCC 23134 TaxID=313606 RepID=A1ZK00_MICM2|nr:hypothetical protein [Microscilla marina]EAY29453.1 hypothetical protein M23134_01513 [Microscilla marina ATCC 23134]